MTLSGKKSKGRASEHPEILVEPVLSIDHNVSDDTEEVFIEIC